MKTASIRPSSLDGLKKLAKKLKQERGIPHTEALELASRQAGYQSFVHARRSFADATGGTAAASYPVFLTAHWYERRAGANNSSGLNVNALDGAPSRRAGRELLQIRLSRPLPSIVTKQRVGKTRGLGTFVMEYDDHLEMHYLVDSQQRARELLLLAERTLRFMEVTGLQPVSHQAHRQRLQALENLPGHDHTSNWFDPTSGAVAMLDEPYPAALNSNADERAVRLAGTNFAEVSLLWEGLHNPGLTKPFLLSNDQSLLARVSAAVTGLPRYEFPATWPSETGNQGDAFMSPQRIRDSKPRRPIPNASYTNRMGATPYGGSFGTPSRWRPIEPMTPALHIELGSILYRLADFDVPWKVHERLHTHFRSELENWANYEYPGQEIGYQAYYGQEPLMRFKTPQQHLEGIKRAKEIVEAGYKDCKPRRELLAAIDAYISAVT